MRKQLTQLRSLATQAQSNIVVAKQHQADGRMMREAVAPLHGAFGRVCLYSMDRRMVPHAHREGHQFFRVHGGPGEVCVDGSAIPLAPDRTVAVKPWQTHLNAPRTERVIERLTGTNEAVAVIRLDLGFSSKASFSRFFMTKGLVPPSTYRRSAQIAYSQ